MAAWPASRTPWPANRGEPTEVTEGVSWVVKLGGDTCPFLEIERDVLEDGTKQLWWLRGA